jgi:hypothetical protein
MVYFWRMSDESKPKEAKQKRTRSPAYPAIDLQTAIARAATLWTKINRHAAPLDSIAGYWGYDAKSSKAMSEAAAMIKYGILSDEGIGSNRTIKLTESGIKLSYNPDKDSPDYSNGLKKAALLPAIHQELWERYQGNLPDEAVIKRYLVVDKKFNEQYVDEFISQFNRTIEFAKLKNADMVTETEGSETETPMQSAQVLESENQKVLQASAHFVGKSYLTATPSVLREFNFPLPTGVATLKVPFPLREDDFEILLKTLNVFKEGMVKTELTTVDCQAGNWEIQAKALAESQIEFNLINFNFSHDSEAARKIAVDNNFNFRFNPNNGTAMFKTRQESAKK